MPSANEIPAVRLAPARTAVVVGGGIIGRAIALRLQHAGVATTLVDAGTVRSASWGNAGHIATEQVAPLASWATIRAVPGRLLAPGGGIALPLRDAAAWLPFAARLARASNTARFTAGQQALTALLAQALPAWRDLLRLADAGELLRQDGHFVVWESAKTARDGAARWKAGPTGTATVRDATTAELALLQSLCTARLVGAVRFTGTGQITDLGCLLERLDTAFRAAGGAFRYGCVTRIDPVGTAANVQLEGGTSLSADMVVVAAGARSAALLRPLGFTVPLIAERGYHVQSDSPDWPSDMPPVVFEDRSMIATRFRSGLRVAGFVEFGRVDSPPDRRKWAMLRHHVETLGMRWRPPGQEWMGARPTLPDYLPAIGRSQRHPRLLYAVGHQHLGLTLAAVTAEAITALGTGTPPAAVLQPFDLARFGTA